MIRGLFCPTRTPYFRDEAWNWAQSLMLSSDEVKWTTLYKVHPCKRTGASKMNHFYSHIMSVGSLPASLPSKGLPEENSKGAFNILPRDSIEYLRNLPRGSIHHNTPEAFPKIVILSKSRKIQTKTNKQTTLKNCQWIP